jgi:catechol 2,3-dioxygenase-like lactoylglutathione lyase family enzyme
MPRILQNHYVLAVHDLKRSAGFFVDALGFKVVAEPPGWVFVEKDNCMIMLGACRDAVPPGELGDHSYFGYLHVDDADRYFDELKAKGVEVSSPISDKPWGMREFGLTTPEGHRLMIGQRIGGNPL